MWLPLETPRRRDRTGTDHVEFFMQNSFAEDHDRVIRTAGIIGVASRVLGYLFLRIVGVASRVPFLVMLVLSFP